MIYSTKISEVGRVLLNILEEGLEELLKILEEGLEELLKILEEGLEELLKILEEGLEELMFISEKTFDTGRERLRLSPLLNSLIVSSKSPFAANEDKLEAKLGTSEGRRTAYYYTNKTNKTNKGLK